VIFLGCKIGRGGYRVWKQVERWVYREATGMVSAFSGQTLIMKAYVFFPIWLRWECVPSGAILCNIASMKWSGVAALLLWAR
jgi:hypothetical protein